jgi:hypothetical protein
MVSRLLLIATAVAMVFLLLGLPVPAMAQPSPSPTPSPQEDSDEEPPVWDVGGRIRHAITGWFADVLAAAVEPVFEALGETLFSSPRVDQHPRIAALWKFSLVVADAALVIFVLAGSGIAIAGDEVSSRLTLKEMLPRLLIAAATVNLSLLAIGYLISLSNALALGFIGAAVDPSDISRQLVERLFSVIDNPFMALVALLMVVLAILVLVAYVIRVAVLVIVAVGGPLFLVTHSLPQTDEWARAWWRALLALLAAPVAQAMVLAATLRVLLSGNLLGLPAGGGLIDLLVIGCLLYLLFKIPFWALNTALRGAGTKALRAARQQARALARVVTP